MKTSILTLVAAAAVACGSAQAHILMGEGASKASSSKSTLAVMTAAGIHYHARANYKNEQRLYGSKFVTTSSAVRPDDRAGRHGV